mmetsp:Transcript_43062/g.77294  ORF Transcript_43062/g.77294 Transcript_43062/m.77294 type:complete len:187 (-) Transcript_43062:58-618(-)
MAQDSGVDLTNTVQVTVILPTGVFLTQLNVTEGATGADIKTSVQSCLTHYKTLRALVTNDRRIIENDDDVFSLGKPYALTLHAILVDSLDIAVDHVNRSSFYGWPSQRQENAIIPVSASDSALKVKDLLSSKVEGSLWHRSTTIEKMHFTAGSVTIDLTDSEKTLAEHGFVPSVHQLVVETNTVFD